MFYMIYDYLAWLAGYTSASSEEVYTVVELKETTPLPPPPSPEPEVLKKEETPHDFPSLNFTQPISIAQLETEQENIEPIKSYLIYPKRSTRRKN